MAAGDFLGQRLQGVGVDGEGVDADRRHAHLQAERLEHGFRGDEPELDEHVAQAPAGLLLPRDARTWSCASVSSPRSRSSAPSAFGPSTAAADRVLPGDGQMRRGRFRRGSHLQRRSWRTPTRATRELDHGDTPVVGSNVKPAALSQETSQTQPQRGIADLLVVLCVSDRRARVRCSQNGTGDRPHQWRSAPQLQCQCCSNLIVMRQWSTERTKTAHRQTGHRAPVGSVGARRCFVACS